MSITRVIFAVLIVAFLFFALAVAPTPSMAQQQLPDLIILSAWQTDSQICYSIKNIGQGSVGGAAAPVSYYNALSIDGQQVAEDHVTASLAPGQQLDRCFSYQFQMTLPQHTIRVCADWRQNITESSEQNNCWQDVWVMEEALPDLVVERIECGPGNKLSVTIKNIGSGALPSGWRGLADTYFDGARKGAFDLTYPTSTLNGGIGKPGGSSVYLPGWDITTLVTVRVIADSANEIRESNEQNNSRQEQIEPLGIKLPDLLIKQIICNRENSRIGYVIKNGGEAVVPPGHASVLFVDDKAVCKDVADLELAPGETHESWFGCYTWPECHTIKVRVCADNYNQVQESNEQNNCFSKTCQCVGDIGPPIVTIAHSPSDITIADEVTFTVQARDDTGVVKILIFINEEQLMECTPGSEKIDTKGRNYWECAYTGGPYPEGVLTYHAEAIDGYENRGFSDESRVEVTAVTFVTPPPVFEACFFSISGTIHNFGHNPETLKIKVCEAETIMLRPDGGPPTPITSCKEGGWVRYVEVTRRFAGDLPEPELDYYIGRLCRGEYIVAPVYQPGVDLCEWQGSWRTTKGQVVTIADSSAEGFDFTFEPLDSRAPMVSNIVADPERPKLGDNVVVTILAEDDREIASIWEKTDKVFVDGSFHPGHWHSLTVTPRLEGSTAGAQFSLTDDRIMQATVTAKACDIGGNSHMSQKIIYFGSCDDGIQNQGETGIDCGGPCPSQCKDCLNDLTIGTSPSAYLYSPDEMDYVRGHALGALFEYANHVGVSASELDTSDEYVDAITWWVDNHMGYRGDDVNERCLNEILGLDYDPEDYEHGDFPQPAYYTLNYSGRVITDPTKWFFGDCEDFAILTSALLRSLGMSHTCIFNAEHPGHGFNIVNYRSKYRVLEPQTAVIGCEGFTPYNIWNDKLGAFVGTDFPKVQPWEYTMNYPGCEHPSVTVSGGGFGGKTLWFEWDGWGRNLQPAVGDFNDDGKDDVTYALYDDSSEHINSHQCFFSTGSAFEPGTGSPYRARHTFEPIVVRASGRDYIVALSDGYLDCVLGTPRDCPTIRGYETRYYPDAIGVGSSVRIGDPDGDGDTDVIEFQHGDEGNVYVNGDLWKTDFSPRDEIPFVGDFDGDGYDDIVSFARGRWAGVRVGRSVPGEDRFHAHFPWHPWFCPEDEQPLIGDFNGDGRQDIIAFQLDTGNVFVGLSTKFGFWSGGFGRTQALWATDFCHEGDTPLVGDFNGDGRDDIACLSVAHGTARIWVSLAAPSTMTYHCGGNLCDQAAFYLDAYWPSVCP